MVSMFRRWLFAHCPNKLNFMFSLWERMVYTELYYLNLNYSLGLTWFGSIPTPIGRLLGYKPIYR